MPEKASPERFKTEMPRIPGVADAPPAVEKPSTGPVPAAENSKPLGRSTLLSIALGVTIVLVGGIGWWAIHSAGRGAESSSQEASGTAPATPDLTVSPTAQDSGPVTAAALSELAKPWASKEFTYVDPLTHDSVPAIVVHLAGGAPGASASYWAFSLKAPYQACQLAYVTDLSELATRFGYAGATHPMVASLCDATVYDPLKIATLASGAWVRGEIVQGAGIRPPISIEVKVEGSNLIADRIE